MSKESVKKYIEFRPAGTSKTGLTKIWHVVNPTRYDDQLGVIRWAGNWRKYVFEQSGTVYYDWDCLRVIADFIEAQTKDYYDNKLAHRSKNEILVKNGSPRAFKVTVRREDP